MGAQVVQKDSLYSNYLKEQKPLEIIFPKNFKHCVSDKFDVLYVLDGEWNTTLAVRAYEFLEYAKFVPTNIIIVNVPNYYQDGMNMRDRDFTPTAMEGSPMAGRANNFLLSLKEELIPFVTGKCRVEIEDNILYGTSSGGFIRNLCLLTRTKAFYIIYNR
ncbi:alpha/beta hydrolase-fold protein [Allomuricauda taeanensis]|uniref:alpha/beta hydrolase-fold protein n=1 Tax=Flagellimonas taeanensis TaxID=1005926 RepID=UPI002E7AC2C9|nr:alpha/beta hydrolase-fold protein [Allomuricauda taeanensis]MEE1964333.1 alpha/beta hydrolase-fold protein [Allomuricauda taeanensis]